MEEPTKIPIWKVKDGHTLENGKIYDENHKFVGLASFDNPPEEEIFIEEHWSLQNRVTFKPILWEELDKMEFPEQKWRIKNLIPKEGFVILASISGCRKTWVALEMAKAIVKGTNFLDSPLFETVGGNCLYVDMEMSKSEIQRRGRQLDLKSGENKFLILSQHDLNLNDEDGKNSQWLIDYIKENKIIAVIIDTFRAVAGGMKEEKAEEVRKFFNRFKPLKDAGVAVVFLDHMRKPNNFEGKIPKKEHLFASQDKTASVEVLLMLRNDEGSEEIEVYQRKNRLSKEIEPFKIVMQDCTVEDQKKTTLSFGDFIEDKGLKKDQIKEFILEILPEGGRTSKEIIAIVLEKLKGGSKNTREALRELVIEKRISQTRKGKSNYYNLPEEEQQEDFGIFNDDGGNFDSS